MPFERVRRFVAKLSIMLLPSSSGLSRSGDALILDDLAMATPGCAISSLSSKLLGARRALDDLRVPAATSGWADSS